MGLENERLSQQIKPEQTAAYQLPYENSAIEAFLLMANNAKSQATATYSACQRAMSDNENTTTGVLPSFPQLKDAFATGIVYSTKSLLLSAEAAYQAQTSVCGALAAALNMARQQRELLTGRISEVTAEIAALDVQAAALRAAFAKAADDAGEAYASDEAKKLLSCLEQAYQKHGLIKTLQNNVAETNANIEYLREESHTASLYQAQIESLLHRAEEEWQRAIDLFQLGPDMVDQVSRCANTLLQPQPAALVVPPQAAPATEAEAEAETKAEAPARPSAGSVIWSYVKIIFVAFLIAVALRAYVFDVTRVEGLSMYPTLHDGDNLITSKISYLLDSPQRGDIVVLQAPDSPGEDYIKRIIALPNEELEIKGGAVYINGVLLDEPYLNGLETGGDIHTVIPDGFYFVMGDNRGESRDSRVENVGPINASSIHGKAVLRIWPFNSLGTLEYSE